MDPREHVLERTGMYAGSVVPDKWTTHVYDREAGRMVKRDLTVVPALYKVFDELVVNAIDHVTRMAQAIAAAGGPEASDVVPVRNIRIAIDRASGRVDVTNDGDGLEVELHPEHKLWVPEMVFGHLLTSSNYNDDEERVVGGQNGLGAKICNILSTFFEIETVDHRRKKVYTQAWHDNMSRADKPSVRACAKKPYTRVSFVPDYARFGMPGGLSDDMAALFEKRCYDACALTDASVSVWLNGEKIDCKTFERYTDLYLGPKADHPRVYERIGERWEVVASYTDAMGFEQVSFANGIWTVRGGKHVDHVAAQVCAKLAEVIEKRRKCGSVKPQHVKSHLVLFVKGLVANPTFDSQTKDLLTTPASRFGSKVDIDDKFIDKLYKTGIAEHVAALSGASEDKQLKKTDGKKTGTVRGIVKLDDATWAGTARSAECTLILTEGDSAKAMALSGLEVVGRERYGVFPLRGKLLNVKDVAAAKLAQNEEIATLKKILGLESGRDYDAEVGAGRPWPLRYGRVMAMCDSDVDGSHIKGLLFNLFQTLWPSLFARSGFLCSLLTPIVKARKGSEELQFHNLTDYENWQRAGDRAGWAIKYYKGLATSKDDEARAYFRDMRMVEYVHTAEGGASTAAIDLAFNKKRADDRKEWLGGYDRQAVLVYGAGGAAGAEATRVPYEDFVHRELIHFSNYDVERSIPSAIDGLKISQRKVLYGCFKRNLVSEVRVAQLAAYVSEHTAYHHGEASLQGTIVGMAQDFVGSNNVNVLLPNGQFGTRVQGGKNAGSPRYIYTQLGDAAFRLFRREDAPVLRYGEDDGLSIEPEWYAPIVPMVLVNGALGIGTGFSTSVPCYNPRDVAGAVRRVLEARVLRAADPEAGAAAEAAALAGADDLVPWYRGYTGSIERHPKGRGWVSRGRYERLPGAAPRVRVTELPVGTWTEDYKEMLEAMLERGDIKAYESNYYNDTVDFVITFASAERLDALMGAAPGSDEDGGRTQLEAFLKLASTKNLGTGNMFLFNARGQITKYAGPGDVVREFVDVRMGVYARRKEHQLAQLARDAQLARERVRFLDAVISGEVQVARLNKAALEARLEELAFPRLAAGAAEPSYDYLVRMPIYNMTPDKKRELEEELAAIERTAAELRDTTLEAMWTRELDELEQCLARVETGRAAARAGEAAAGGSKGGKAAGGAAKGGRGRKAAAAAK